MRRSLSLLKIPSEPEFERLRELRSRLWAGIWRCPQFSRTVPFGSNETAINRLNRTRGRWRGGRPRVYTSGDNAFRCDWLLEQGGFETSVSQEIRARREVARNWRNIRNIIGSGENSIAFSFATIFAPPASPHLWEFSARISLERKEGAKPIVFAMTLEGESCERTLS
jgi:hypothetical protein